MNGNGEQKIFVSTKQEKKIHLFCAYGQMTTDSSRHFRTFSLFLEAVILLCNHSHVCVWGPEVHCHEIQLVSPDPQASPSFDYNSFSSLFETLLFSISSPTSSHEGSVQSKVHSHNVQGPQRSQDFFFLLFFSEAENV